jgi:hypothetical protein
VAFLLALALAAAAPSSASESDWSSSRSMHFVIHHESPRLPMGFTGSVEAGHRKVSAELSSLATWLVAEKIDVYLYRNTDSYHAGRFHPPAWSDGIALTPNRPGAPKGIAVFEGVSGPTFAHELSHLVLGSWFLESGRRPPRWLDEGLAMLVESELAVGRPIESGPSVQDPEPAESFTASQPGRDASSERVNAWYAQAESMTRFLKRAKSPFQFPRLCRALRDGDKLEHALFTIYAFRSLKEFETAWRAWASSRGPGLVGEARPSLPSAPGAGETRGGSEEPESKEAPSRQAAPEPSKEPVPLVR